MKISLICPSKGRPYNMMRFWQSAYDNAVQKDKLEVVFRFDTGDHESIEQAQELNSKYGEAIKWIADKPVTMSQMNNEAQQIATGEIFNYTGDDLTYDTKSWDNLVRREFQQVTDRLVLVYGDDLINGAKLATHGFLHKTHIDVLGYFMMPIFSAFFADTASMEIYHNLGRLRYIPEMITQHWHFSNNKASIDRTTQEMHDRNRRDCNEKIWYNSLPKRVGDTQQLLAYINHVNGTSFELRNYERIL